MAKQMNKQQMPSKTKVNLAGAGLKKPNVALFIVGLVLIVVLAVLFSKFCVYDRLAAVSRAQGEVSRLQAEVDREQEIIDSLSDVSERYAHYTYSDMTYEELAVQDRIQVLELLEKDVFSAGLVTQWTMQGNEINLPVSCATLQEINLIAETLEGEDMVSYVTVNTAISDDFNQVYEEGLVTAQLRIILADAMKGE